MIVPRAVGAICVLAASLWPVDGGAATNILWISCEDMGPHLGAYGDRLARTPVLDASEGAHPVHSCLRDGPGLRAEPRGDHHPHVRDAIGRTTCGRRRTPCRSCRGPISPFPRIT